MNKKEIESFVNGKRPLVNVGGSFVLGEPIAAPVKTVPRFKVGDHVGYDHIAGSFGRECGEGDIKEVNGMYLIEFKPGFCKWFHERFLFEVDNDTGQTE